jgi:hypothetical protein
MKLLLLCVTAAVAAAQPVSYSRQVEPILAMNCHLCHGANPDSAAGGLSTRTFADLTKGGNLGQAIVAGDPERSPLYQFISGARGEAHRMPLGGPALAAAEVATIRRWIAEGARADRGGARPHRISLASVSMTAPLRVRARVSPAAYIELEAAGDSRVLFLDGGAVRDDGGVAAIGRPGEWLEWSLRRAPDWPARVRLTLTVSYTPSRPVRAELVAGERRASLSH